VTQARPFLQDEDQDRRTTKTTRPFVSSCRCALRHHTGLSNRLKRLSAANWQSSRTVSPASTSSTCPLERPYWNRCRVTSRRSRPTRNPRARRRRKKGKYREVFIEPLSLCDEQHLALGQHFHQRPACTPPPCTRSSTS